MIFLRDANSLLKSRPERRAGLSVAHSDGELKKDGDGFDVAAVLRWLIRWFVGCASGCRPADSVAQALLCADPNLKKSLGYL